MAHGSFDVARARGVIGLTLPMAGTGLLVAALAGPASAHESTVEPPKDEGLSCAELASEHAGGQTWQQFTIDDVADGDHSETYTVGDVGTVTVSVKGGKTFEWSSTLGVDAVYVQGRDADVSPNSYFYLYAPDAALDGEATEDVDLGTPPWHKWDTNKIQSISFCFDEENKTPPSSDTPTSTESTTTSTESTTTSVESTTTSTGQTTTTQPATTTTASGGGTTSSVQVITSDDTLPKTGSDNTWMLLALGAVLVLGGGTLIATTRIFRRRSG